MGSMLPYIAAPWIRHGIDISISEFYIAVFLQFWNLGGCGRMWDKIRVVPDPMDWFVVSPG